MSDEYKAIITAEDANAVINDKLKKTFDGRIVRKDLTKRIKEGANVPVYVLEFLLGQYCSSDDEFVIDLCGTQNNIKMSDCDRIESTRINSFDHSFISFL